MKALPYFKWFPADAETDEAYVSMSDQQLGFFHRCLNRAWLNDGLPADLDQLAGVMRVTRKYLDTIWRQVGKCWYEENGRLLNPRQEEERKHAIEKSAKASDAVRTRYGRRTDALPRAYVSVCVSESVSEEVKTLQEEKQLQEPDFAQKIRAPRAADLTPNDPPSERFEEVWAKWPLKVEKDAAAQAWLSVVPRSQEERVLACVRRYLASGQVERGAVQKLAGWLWKQGRDNWEAAWPLPPRPPETAIDRLRRKSEEAEEFKRAVMGR